MEPTTRSRALRLDLLFYLVCATFAAASAVWSEFYGYRVWGNLALVGYLLAAGYSGWLLTARRSGSRWPAVLVAGVLAILVPLVILVVRRSPAFVWGPWPWSFPAQPEVWVIERSARLLLADGTPYLDLGLLGRPPHPDDYTPYGPVMSVFGLPRAVFGDHPLTDARLAFAAASALAIVLALRLLRWPRLPVLAAQLVVVSPLTALTLTVAGDDLPIIALIVLATALLYRTNPALPGVVCALVVNMKLTALPAAVVLAVAVAVHRGGRGLVVFLAAAAASSAAVVLPVLLADPGAFVEHVVKFPAGLGAARSPAASPLPGHLISRLGPAGHAAALALLTAAAVAITVWLVVRPPRSESQVLSRIATGLGAAIILAPATRWGYLVYPVTLIGAMVGFAHLRRTAAHEDREGTRGRLPDHPTPRDSPHSRSRQDRPTRQ